jgi:hypothetical protein
MKQTLANRGYCPQKDSLIDIGTSLGFINKQSGARFGSQEKMIE